MDGLSFGDMQFTLSKCLLYDVTVDDRRAGVYFSFTTENTDNVEQQTTIGTAMKVKGVIKNIRLWMKPVNEGATAQPTFATDEAET